MQSWTFKIIPKTATINALVSLSLDPSTVDSDFIQVKYHKVSARPPLPHEQQTLTRMRVKDQANDKEYSHEGVGFSFKKWQADQVAKHMDSEEVQMFKDDSGAAKTPVNTYGSGKESGNAPVKDFTPGQKGT